MYNIRRHPCPCYCFFDMRVWHEIVVLCSTKLKNIIYEQSTLCHSSHITYCMGTGIFRVQCWIFDPYTSRNRDYSGYFPIDSRRKSLKNGHLKS